MGIPLSLQRIEQDWMDSVARGRLARGQVVVEELGPLDVMVYRVFFDKEPVLLSVEVKQFSVQLARASFY
ncbi:two-component sensor histidine kinase, partial [Pseudomonas syringae pv. tagetis]